MSKHSDIAEHFNGLREERRDRRMRLGVECPRCAEVRPKASPSILLPGSVARLMAIATRGRVKISK